MFLPSKGENFGHIIMESLAASTPVIISDLTPWKDLENARAMFKSGQIQDAFAEEGQHKADYALFDYLEGRITQLLDPAGNSKTLFDRVKKLRPGFPIPSRSHNLLIVAAVNSGPVK